MNLKFKHKKRKITTAQWRLTPEEIVDCLSISVSPPCDNHVNSSHGDQRPDGNVDLVQRWHWRDPKPDFSDDYTLDMVA